MAVKSTNAVSKAHERVPKPSGVSGNQNLEHANRLAPVAVLEDGQRDVVQEENNEPAGVMGLLLQIESITLNQRVHSSILCTRTK